MTSPGLGTSLRQLVRVVSQLRAFDAMGDVAGFEATIPEVYKALDDVEAAMSDQSGTLYQEGR